MKPAILPAMILTFKTTQAAGVLRPCRLGAVVRSAKRTESIPSDAPPTLNCLRTSIPNSEENVERLAGKNQAADERGKNIIRRQTEKEIGPQMNADKRGWENKEEDLQMNGNEIARQPKGKEIKGKASAFIGVHRRTKN